MKKVNDYVVTLENVLTPNLCNAILEEYSGTDEWRQTTVGNGEVRENVRSANVISISQECTIHKNESVRKKLDSYVFASVADAIRRYKEKFTHCSIDSDSGYDLLRYETGQFYTEHTDSFAVSPRAVSCSLALNDDYEGGEFGFFGRELVIKVPKGGAVLFPSNFMYPHEIMPVTKGTRYSIITWFI